MKVLIIGNGFTGSEIGKKFADKHQVTLCARTKQNAVKGCNYINADASNRGQLVKVLDKINPEAIVLVHGPSDITWCEANMQEAMSIHCKIAENVSLEAPNCYTALISTDNVFSGEKEICNENDMVMPANAYGRAKLAAENILREKITKALVLRVSLIYGWEAVESDRWKNFFAKTVYTMRNNKELFAPYNHWNTPVLVSDVAAVMDALVNMKRTGLLHLGGKERLTRVEWAKIIAEVFNLDKSLIRPISKDDTRYACRPQNACLSSLYLYGLPEMEKVQIKGIAEAAQWLKENMKF